MHVRNRFSGGEWPTIAGGELTLDIVRSEARLAEI